MMQNTYSSPLKNVAQKLSFIRQFGILSYAHFVVPKAQLEDFNINSKSV